MQKCHSRVNEGGRLPRKIPFAKSFLTQAMTRPNDGLCKSGVLHGSSACRYLNAKLFIWGCQHHEDVLGPKVTIDTKVIARGVEQLESTSITGPRLDGLVVSGTFDTLNLCCG